MVREGQGPNRCTTRPGGGNIVHNLVVVEAIKYVKLQRAYKKNYEMSIFHCSQRLNALLSIDDFNGFKVGFVNDDHDLHY